MHPLAQAEPLASSALRPWAWESLQHQDPPLLQHQLQLQQHLQHLDFSWELQPGLQLGCSAWPGQFQVLQTGWEFSSLKMDLTDLPWAPPVLPQALLAPPGSLAQITRARAMKSPRKAWFCTHPGAPKGAVRHAQFCARPLWSPK